MSINTRLKQDDRNTKFFYATSKTRLSRNRILAIEDETNMIKKGDYEINKLQNYISSNYSEVKGIIQFTIWECLKVLTYSHNSHQCRSH